MMNQAVYDLARVHWKMQRKSVFPASLQGRSVEFHEQNAGSLRRRTMRKHRQPSNIIPKVYDYGTVAQQITVHLSNVFEHEKEAYSHEVCELQGVLEKIVSVLDGDERQYFWRLAEMVKFFCLPEERERQSSVTT